MAERSKAGVALPGKNIAADQLRLFIKRIDRPLNLPLSARL
jgi:hypothetical protein